MMPFLILFVLGYAISGFSFLVVVLRIGYPHHRSIAGILYAVSWIPFIAAGWKGKEYMVRYNNIVLGFLATYWWYILGLALLIGIGYVLWVLFPQRESPLNLIRSEEISWKIKGDTKNLLYIHDRLLELRDTFKSIVDSIDRKQQPNREQIHEIKDLWQEFYNLFFELDILKGIYRKFYLIHGFKKREMHADAFFIAYGALLLQYSSIILITELVGKKEQIKTILNEKNEAESIRHNSYALLQKLVIMPEVLLQLSAGRGYRRILNHKKIGAPDLDDMCKKCLKEMGRITKKRTNVLLRNPVDYLEKKMFQSWFPVQKNVALQMSYLRIPNRPYFIHPRTIAKFSQKILPGDILFERREWHMTNVGIPGYWTHNALHVGSLKKMDEYFAGLGFKASEVLEKTLPHIFEHMTKKDVRGFAVSVIEAKREGVILQSLEESASADALGVLRPRVSIEEKWQAILRAFSHFGKPYDYNFDFATDNQLVCSEVVYKAYEGTGLHLNLHNLNGRTIISPNDIMKKFHTEYDLETRELDFVLFLDSKNSTRSVFENTYDALRTSWKRPKWHIVFS